MTFALLLAIGTAAGAGEPTNPVADGAPHPVLPEPSHWPGYLFRAVGATFLLAAVIGPIVRKGAPRDLPPATHSHDEPPGTSGHHGPSGTFDESAPDRA